MASGDVIEVQCCAAFFSRVGSSHHIPGHFATFRKFTVQQFVYAYGNWAWQYVYALTLFFLSSFGGVSRVVLYRIVTALLHLFLFLSG